MNQNLMKVEEVNKPFLQYGLNIRFSLVWYIPIDNEVLVKMDKAKIEEYLEIANDKGRSQLSNVVNTEGSINDIDYYVEVIKRYYPNEEEENIKGPLVIEIKE